MDSAFLDAEWRKLLMINYSVEAALLKPYLPYKTELDYWNNRCYVSLVGFMFLNTKVKGFSIPFHENFEELNLRFYVRYKADHEWRRGVVFVKEIVPRRAISWVANTLYKEHYETLPMSHRWNRNEDELTVEYHWKKGHWNSIKATTSSASLAIQAGSEEEFITEHYWGYSKKMKKARWNTRSSTPAGRFIPFGISASRWISTAFTAVNSDF